MSRISNIMPNLGTRIVNLRLRNKVSQKTLAQIAGVSIAAVSKWEIGNSAPTNQRLILIEDHFGLKRGELKYGNEKEIASYAYDFTELYEGLKVGVALRDLSTDNYCAIVRAVDAMSVYLRSESDYAIYHQNDNNIIVYPYDGLVVQSKHNMLGRSQVLRTSKPVRIIAKNPELSGVYKLDRDKFINLEAPLKVLHLSEFNISYHCYPL